MEQLLLSFNKTTGAFLPATKTCGAAMWVGEVAGVQFRERA
jgi:hypothetical protein